MSLQSLPLEWWPALGFIVGFVPPLLVPSFRILGVVILILGALFVLAFANMSDAVAGANNGFVVAVLLTPIITAALGLVCGGALRGVTLVLWSLWSTRRRDAG